MSKKAVVETPLMKQYFAMKQKHPDAILLFRVGDFYETFCEDAISASGILGITLTRRANGAAQSIELAGFPHHALDTYLPKLVRAGKRVAICEQLEDPKLAKKLVKRGITELVTPGISTSDNLLDNRENNFLAAVHFGKGAIGVSFLDISTGEFLTAQGDAEYVEKLLGNFAPKEVLVERGKRQVLDETFSQKYLSFELDDWMFTEESATERLLKHFQTQNLKGFGIGRMTEAIVASGVIMHYLDQTQHTHTSHITSISRIEEQQFVRLDKFTVRNLELTQAMGEDGRSLLDVIDMTATPMGARMLRRWLLFPLKDVPEINRRHDVVEYFMRHPDDAEELHDHLASMGDLERLVSKVALGRVNPRELLQLRNALQALAPIKAICLNAEGQQDALSALGRSINCCEEISSRIGSHLMPDAPAVVNKGMVIASGVDAELDELRDIAYRSKDYLMRIQAREVEATGISSLKIGYNNVFGYYIEVTNTHRSKVPPEWIRKQTLVNAERYITQELKEYEEKILGAQEKILSIESRLFNELVGAVGQYVETIKQSARVVADIDCLASFTRVAVAYRYNRPVVDDSLEIDIREGRHPVIERQLPPGEPYISNSVSLSNSGTQIMMITGPNMSGKSALLRQTALIVILAQIGSFVPAESARIGIVDKVFTRVGANDNISFGESTFMVEMNEAASIINNMSERSLILFDELGRGTSTYDGISIAWAIVEHIHEHGKMHPKTLFATHYHDLNEMERTYQRIVNYNVSVLERDGKVVFLRKLAKGGSAHSFGIHVARLAGMPRSIVERADEVLRQLEKNNSEADAAVGRRLGSMGADSDTDGMQLTLFQLDDPVLSQIRDEILSTDINNLTPVAALNKLNEIKSIITGK